MAAMLPNRRTILRFSMLAIAWLCVPFVATAELPERIVWYGVLEDGLEEALITGKPVLLTSAAPQCASVPGMW